MRTIEEIIDNLTLQYPIDKLAPKEEILFIDIETTGFTARSSYLYMIGCAYYSTENGHEGWRTIQWMAENYDQEAQIIKAFFEFSEKFKFLIHFNGNNFDLPFITQKCQLLDLPYSFENIQGIDLYRRISPYKFFLKLPNCKQKTIESFLGIEREDVFTGGELIGIYHDYVKSPSEFAEKTIFLHNSDDLRGMLSCLPILAYNDLINDPLKVTKVQANSYRDVNGQTRKELIMFLRCSMKLPKAITASAADCYLKAENDTVTIKVPIIEEELKYFYSNYKDYYYLPAEDIALHKSVAGFVDRSHRVQATAATCYTRKKSEFLPQWDVVIEPFFTRDQKSRELFFELTDELKRDRGAFERYAQHILQTIVETY